MNKRLFFVIEFLTKVSKGKNNIVIVYGMRMEVLSKFQNSFHI